MTFRRDFGVCARKKRDDPIIKARKAMQIEYFPELPPHPDLEIRRDE